MKRSILKPGILIAGVISTLLLGNLRLVGQTLDEATLLTRSEAYDKAKEVFDQLIKQDPGNSKYYFFYGENWLQDYFADTISNSLTNFTNEAKALYEKGIKANPNDPLNYVGLAKVAFYNKDYKTADEMRAKAKSFLLPYRNLRRISPPAPEYAYTLAKLAESYITVNFTVDSAKALPLIRQAISIDYKNRDIYLIAGDIYNIKNDGSNAIKNYNLAQDYDPTSPTANMKIGSIYVRAKNLGAAIPWFEKAIELNANYAPAYRELGALYASARRYDQAREYFEKYLELTKGNIPAKIRYVQSLYFAGEYDEAIKNIEEIFAVDKSRAYLNRLAAYSCYEKKDADYDKALQYMDALFASLPPDLIIQRDYLYLAKILLKKNQNYPYLVRDRDRYGAQLERDKIRYSNATSSSERARFRPTIDTLNARISRLDKQITTADKDVDRAFGEYAKALTFDPENTSLLTEIANNYYTFNRYELAARTWAKVIALGKNSIDDIMKLGRWYYTGENYQAADSVFNVVLKMDPKYLDAYVYIARTYSKMEGDPKVGKARPKFEKVIEVASADTAKNTAELMEAYQYLGYHYMVNDNYTQAKRYFEKMTTLDPNDTEAKTRGYLGLAQLETRKASTEKTIEGRLPYLSKAQEWYNRILAYDSNNQMVRTALRNVQEFEAQVRKGINPNELKGVVRTQGGQPVPNASVRVKDTAAETYTNSRGEFKFEIPQSSEALIISANGKQKEVPVSRPLRPLTIILE
jgi:tetratricopeptide (TPR) repeat protein